MASTKVTFDNKVSTITSPLPEINRITGANINEIKTAINNNADLLDETAAAVGVISPNIAITSATKTLTIGALTTASGNMTLTKEGYMPCGVAGLTSSSGNLDINSFYMSEAASGTCKINYTFYSRSTGSGTPTITAYVNWIKIN
jgi:hypothetical protein